MANSSLFGSSHVDGRKWTPHVEVSPQGIGSTPPGDWKVDPYLPGLATDPFNPAGVVVIPLGRFVGIGNAQGVNTGGNTYRISPTYAGGTPLTLHDGRYQLPHGMSVNQMYKDVAEEWTQGEFTAKFRRGFLAELPFVLSVNNAHGALFSGDRVTGYWGSTTSDSNTAFVHKGKPVKWVAKGLYYVSAAASASIQLTAAIYPGIQPRVVATLDVAGATLAPTVTLTWSAGFAKWVASFTGTGSGSVTQIFYEHGQEADQIAGEVFRITSITEILNSSNFLKWVEYAPQDMLNFPPAASRFPVTEVNTETPATVTAGIKYRVANYPMSIHHTVLVEVTGAEVTDANGSTTTYTAGTWFPLPTGTVTDFRNQFIGLYHNVNWFTGVIELGANIVDIAGFDIRVSYHYITSPRDAATLWGGGIINLTDGRNITTGTAGSSSATNPYGASNYLTPTSTPFGVPAHLNLSDVVGAMRVWVR